MRDMYSQCPKCRAIFSVSEEVLGVHHGLVRCGHCRSVFQARVNEVGDPRTAAGVPPSGEADSRADVDQAGLFDWPDAQTTAGRDLNEVGAPAGDAVRREEERSGDYPYEEDAGGRRPGDPETGDGSPGEAVVSGERRTDSQEPDGEAADEEGFGEQGLVEEAPVADESSEEAPAGESPDTGGPREEALTGERVQPPPSGTEDSGDRPAEQDSEWQGEVVEEILIEAPPVLWNAFDEEPGGESKIEDSRAGDVETGPAGDRDAEKVRGKGAAPGKKGRHGTGRRTPPKSPYWARDITMVELPRPRPFKAATLGLLTVLLALLLAWQVKAFYLDELAQVPVLRPYLEWVCRPLDCVLPPRRSFAEVDLVGTNIDVNPEIPGALAITASLINRAHFPQPYPPLRVTLTDREGRVVGQRTYLPSEYRGDDGRELLPIREARNVSINLAQPSENAVGYEVELITPARDG